MTVIYLFIYPPHPRTAATLRWKTSRVHNDNFQYLSTKIDTLQWHSPKQHPVYVHSTQPVRVQVQLLVQIMQVFKVSVFFVHTGLKSLLPFVNSIVHSAL